MSEGPGPGPEVVWDVAEPVLEEGQVARAVAVALRLGGRPGLLLAIAFVDDESLARLHADRLGDPSRTDVMAFDLGQDGHGPAGELYVSVDRARAVSARRGVALERELLLYVVHGVLHLCGFDDHEDEQRRRMRAAEASVLAELGFEPDLARHELGADDTPESPSTE